MPCIFLQFTLFGTCYGVPFSRSEDCSNYGFFSLFQASIDYDDMSDQHISVSFHKDKARLLDED
jgi:hypothetical protein